MQGPLHPVDDVAEGIHNEPELDEHIVGQVFQPETWVFPACPSPSAPL